MKRRTTAVVAFAATAAVAQLGRADLSADQTPFHSYRGLWVSRFEYSNTAASVDSVFANAQALGITDVMFQVRGQADAYYNSKQVGGNYFEHRTSTSFDALQRAIQQGHSRGIKVHAWMNAMPLWNGTTLPTDTPGNPYVINTHPEYWIRDSTNTPQPLNSSYVIVNPTQPDVKQHLYDVVDDITSKYAVDGIHLDYIRFTNSSSGGSPILYPTDPASVARFQSIPGNAGKTPVSHKSEYQAWMAANITDIVSNIRQTMKDNRPEAQLTAAIWRDANIGYNDYQQDWKTWVDRGLLDAGMPMIYRKGFGTGGPGMSSDSGDLYRNNVTAAMNWRGNSGIMPGLGPYMQDDVATAYGNVLAQLNFARDQGANGVQIFSYTDLLGGNAVDVEVRRAWMDFVAANSSAPPIASITNFEVDEGYFPSNITFSGSNVNVAASSTADRVTSEAHASTASQQLIINKAGAGSFLARHVSGIGTPGSPASNLTFSSIGTIGFWLKTTATDVEVAPAVDDNTANTSTERGYFQNVIADGQWHYYRWFLDDTSHWDAWAGANADGTIESLFTLDSIQFRGTADVNTIFLDDIEYSAAAVAPDQWRLDSAINTNSTDTNWSNAFNWQGTVPNAVGASANLFRRATAAQTVTVDVPITLGSLVFDNINSYTLGGPGSLTLDVAGGNATLAVINRGTHNVNVPVTFNDSTDVFVDQGATLNMNSAINHTQPNSIIKSGTGVLNISGTQSHGAGSSFIAAAGVTNFNTNAGAPGNANLNLTATNAGTRVNFNSDQNIASLSVTSGATADVAGNTVVIDYTGPTPAADIRSMISSAYAGGAWTGPGLTSSLATSSTLGVGYFDDGDTITIELRRFGDANLSGLVNSDDFNSLASNFGTAGKFWQDGDFNYDNLVNSDDFNLLAGNFGLSAGADGIVDPSDWAALAAAVPEPSLLLTGVAASAVMCTRRRRRCGRWIPVVTGIRVRARSGRAAILLVSAVLSLNPAESLGQVSTSWLSPVDGSWSSAPAWSSNPSYPNNGTPAGTSYFAVIGAAGPDYTVSLSDSVAISRLQIMSTSARLEHSAGTFTVPVMTIGDNASGGRYHLSGGTLSTNEIWLGSSLLGTSFGGVGQFEQVAGHVTAGATTMIGFAGNGSLTVDGPQSRFVVPPDVNLPIPDIGNLTYVGIGTDSTESLARYGNAASITLGGVRVGGADGRGTLAVGSGAQVTAGSMLVGFTNDWQSGGIFSGHGTVILDGATSRLTLGQGTITIGYPNTPGGSANVLVNGGTLTVRPPLVPFASSLAVCGTGTVTVNAGVFDCQREVSLLAGRFVVNGGIVSAVRFEITPLSTTFNLGGTLQVSGGQVTAQQLRLFGGNYIQSAGSATFGSGSLSSGPFSTIPTLTLAGGSLSITGSLSIAAGTANYTGGSLQCGSLTLTGGALYATPGADKVVKTNGLTLSGLARVDLSNNAMELDYNTASPASDVRSYISSAFNHGAWDGPGITTSLGTATTHGLGYTDDGDVLRVSFALYGDANLSGNVDSNDFNRLAISFGSSGKFWQHGDFNYDNLVNSDDFNLLAGNFGLSAGADGIVDPSDWAALAAAVPEPAVLGFAALGLLAGRRRR